MGGTWHLAANLNIQATGTVPVGSGGFYIRFFIHTPTITNPLPPAVFITSPSYSYYANPVTVPAPEVISTLNFNARVDLPITGLNGGDYVCMAYFSAGTPASGSIQFKAFDVETWLQYPNQPGLPWPFGNIV
jgi:hypothetical protein